MANEVRRLEERTAAAAGGKPDKWTRFPAAVFRVADSSIGHTDLVNSQAQAAGNCHWVGDARRNHRCHRAKESTLAGCANLPKPNVSCGSKPEVQRGSRNVRSWVKSRRNQRDNGHWPADVASPDLPVPGLHP